MTRLLSALAVGALLVVRQLLCFHTNRTARPLPWQHADGALQPYDCHCENCDARWKEYG